MNELNIDEKYLKVVEVAINKAKEKGSHVIALELPNHKIITGKQSSLLSPASSVIINAIKTLSHIPDDMDLLSPSVLNPILKLRKNNKPLSLQEVLIALSICSVTNPIIEKAIKNLNKLEGCEAHSTYIVQNGDANALKSLKINLTCESDFFTDEII